VPLPSVEATTREGAIAAAREKYGSSARVVAVRKTRSGGVMGFFASERYVAEVEEVPPRRPAPLSDSRRRIEAALSRDDRYVDDWDDDGYAPPRSEPARRPAAARASRPDPVDELAGLLGHGGGEAPELDVYSRSSFTRAAAASRPASGDSAASRIAATTASPSAPAARAAAPQRGRTGAAARPPVTPAAPEFDEPAAPSLFTSALAQVVSDDSEVRAAVEEAVATAAPRARTASSAAEPAAGPPRPGRRTTASSAPAAGAGLAAALAAVQKAAADKAAAEQAAAQRAEATRLAAEQEAARIAAQREAARRAKERAEAEKAAAAEAARLAAEQEAARLTAEQAEAARLAAEQEAARIAAEQEAARLAAEQEAARIAAEQAAAAEAARLAAEQEAARIVAEQEAARLAAEREAARIAAEQSAAAEAARLAVEQAAAAEAARIAAEQEAGRLVDERRAALLAAERGAARLRAEQVAAVEAARMAAEREAVRRVEPITTEFASPTESPVAPEWLSEPELAAGPTSVREEAIAEVLRAALAHDTSDDVLTDILRGVLSNASRRPVPAPAQRQGWVEGAAESDEWEVVADVLAPTASDPAPLALDATAILPPLSLLPPRTPGSQLAIPPLLGGRPPVPPPSRRRPPVPGQAVARVASARAPQGLATVTALPMARAGAWQVGGSAVVVSSVRERSGALVPTGAMVDPRMIEAAGIVTRLRTLGLPEALLGSGFAADIAANGTYAALTRVLAMLPAAPSVPNGPGEVLLVVGPGAETLAAARSLAASLRLDPDRLQWASRGDLANLVPHASRIVSVDMALERKQHTAQAGGLTVVAVDAPLRAGGRTWLDQMLAIWAPSAVWAVVEATRKAEDLGPWLEALPRVDALMVQDTDLTADPAAVLSRAAVPVALLDGARATAHRWASLLCERLETVEA
jgi:hypothetical protein